MTLLNKTEADAKRAARKAKLKDILLNGTPAKYTILIPRPIHHKFKLACLKNRKLMAEVFMYFIHNYVKEELK